MDGSLWLDVDGLTGVIPSWGLSRAEKESAQRRYSIGSAISQLFVLHIDHDERSLYLSYGRSTRTADVVSGTITAFQHNCGLWLDVDGMFGSVAPDELALADGESAQERYAIGETIEGLFVWQVNQKARRLDLSVKRNAPGYVEALQWRAAGDVVSGTITYVGNGLRLNVRLWPNRLVGSVAPDELPLADGESAQERYAVGETIEDLFVWRVNHEARSLDLSLKRNAHGYVEALQRRVAGDVVSGTITDISNDCLRLDVDGLAGDVWADELVLTDGESTQDRYTVGETVNGLFVWNIDHETRALDLSVKRNAPSYLKALRRCAHGDIASGTITYIGDDGTLWLDVDGLVGSVPPWGLHLADGESAQDRYSVGETIDSLVVSSVDHKARDLDLDLDRFVKLNTPGYVEALQRLTVGDVVSGTITDVSDVRLQLNIDGLGASVWRDDLVLADGESAQDHYTIGETLDDLLVLRVNHDDLSFHLSAKRNTPGYAKALLQRVVGDVVSGTITKTLSLQFGVDSVGGLTLDVDGVHGYVLPGDLDLTDGESVQDRYTVGQTIDGLFVCNVDHETRALGLSIKRNAPGYVEALEAIAREDEIDGIVTMATKWGVLLDAAGVVGRIPAGELLLNDGEPPQARYTAGDKITARVWQIDHEGRDIILSMRRLTADFIEGPISLGAEISVRVRGTTPRGVRLPIRVLTTYNSVSIPPHELSLSTGTHRAFEDDEEIRVVVGKLDDEGQPTRLSHRQTLAGWEAKMQRLVPGKLVPHARPVPPVALSDAELRAGATAVDLGPITGFVPEEELDRETGRNVATHNETYPVVIESVDRERGIAMVSHDRFEERWREVAEQLELGEGAEVEGELRDFDSETALLDLGSGLLARMSERELPESDPLGKAAHDRIGERFPLRITAIDRDKQTVHAEPRDQWLEALIGAAESETLEFKQMLRGSDDSKRDLTLDAIRTICAFLNSEGGRLIIGVHDTTRTVTGLEGDPGLDADTIDKKIDQATQTLEDNLEKLHLIDPDEDLRDYLTPPDARRVRGKTLIIITCSPDLEGGVWFADKGQLEFWIRQGSKKRRIGGQTEIQNYRNARRAKRASNSGGTDVLAGQ